MTTGTDIPFPIPKHMIDDAPPWLDLSRFHAFQLEGITPESVAAAHFDDPKDQALMFLRASAIRQRLIWEGSHPHSQRFPGVYLGVPVSGQD